MFCTKCGKQVPDGSVICPFCGSPLAAPQATPAPQAAPAGNKVDDFIGKAKKGNKKSLIFAIAGVVVALVVIVLLISLLGNGPKKIVKTMLKQEEKLEKQEEKLEKKYNLFSNAKALKKLDMDEDDDDDDETETSWKITKVKKFSKKDDVTEGMKAYVKLQDGDEDAIKGSALVEVTYTIKKGKDKNTSKMYFAMVKVGGNWYYMDMSTGKNINDAAKDWEELADED